MDILPLMFWRGHEPQVDGDTLVFGEERVPVRDGIPRFTPDTSYSTGNFSTLREKHATLQFDSVNGSTYNRDTILDRTNWRPEHFKDKLVLECGCGAGPDTETLLSFGAKVVAVDLAGLDIAKNNLLGKGDVQHVQASIGDLPFKRESFDIVYCHRVIQHTPDPPGIFEHLLGFAKPDGRVFIHSYAKNIYQMLGWKYALRPFTVRLDQEKLYAFIKWYAPAAFKISNWLQKLPGGAHLTYAAFPFRNYRSDPKFDALSDEQMLEYGVHDTFDALSPRYDRPLGARTMKRLAEGRLGRPYEVDERIGITLFRSLP